MSCRSPEPGNHADEELLKREVHRPEYVIHQIAVNGRLYPHTRHSESMHDVERLGALPGHWIAVTAQGLAVQLVCKNVLADRYTLRLLSSRLDGGDDLRGYSTFNLR